MRRSEQKAHTRKKVLETARACFLEFGYEATTIAQVATRADVANGTVLSHFPDKQQLVVACFIAEIDDLLLQARAALPSVGIIDQLLTFASTLYRWYARRPELSKALVQATLFEAGQPGSDLSAQLTDFLGEVGRLIAAADGRGELLQPIDPQIAAHGFFADYLAVLIGGLAGSIPSAEAQLMLLRALLSMRLRPH